MGNTLKAFFHASIIYGIGLFVSIENISCTIAVKTSEGGKMFGSVTAAQILEKMTEQGFTLDRNQVKLAAPLHELGVFDVEISLHPEVKATLKVWIVEE